MQPELRTKKDLYYTTDHEWIDFQGAVAYVGVCTFKLTGFKEIQLIKFKNLAGYKKQGDILISVKYTDYLIDVCMPVDGEITEVNEVLISGDKNVLLQHAEGAAWVVKINPAQPYDRTGLLLPNEYQMRSKRQ